MVGAVCQNESGNQVLARCDVIELCHQVMQPCANFV